MFMTIAMSQILLWGYLSVFFTVHKTKLCYLMSDVWPCLFFFSFLTMSYIAAQGIKLEIFSYTEGIITCDKISAPLKTHCLSKYQLEGFWLK